jgi:hypothetical protein
MDDGDKLDGTPFNFSDGVLEACGFLRIMK